jgi:hypothetical protein
VTFAALAWVVLATPKVFAQVPNDGGPDPSVVRVRFGPIWMNPTISMPNVGIDTNVFNEPADRSPKRDFTLTVVPKTDLWLRMGRTWLSGSVTEDIVWYQKYTTQRSANNSYTIGWKAPLNRLVLSTNATWANTRSRPGFEIDERAQRQEPSYGGTIEIRAFAKTFIGMRGGWRTVRFDRTTFFEGTSLQEQLDRTSTSAAISVRHDLTPLTSLIVSAGRSEERFKLAPVRDSTSNEYSVGLTFDPAALVKGSVTLGYTEYKPESADLPEYRGTTAAVALTYTPLGSTRVAATIRRAVESSYDVNQPYYLVTGGTASIGQQIFGPFDLVARGGAHRLRYQSRAGAVVTIADRTDHLRTYGAGFGIHLGKDLRLGVNFDKERRTSPLADRQYEGLKFGSSITYGQ